MKTQKILTVKLCILLLTALPFAENSARDNLRRDILAMLKTLLREVKRDQTQEDTEDDKRILWQSYRLNLHPYWLEQPIVHLLKGSLNVR